MGFLESIRTCLGKYAKFDGRASRSEYWFFVLFSSIYMFVGGFLLGMIGAADLESGIAIWVLMIPIIVPLISAAARRLHDINQSGWMQCIFFPGFIADEFLGTGYVIYFLTLALFAFWFSQAGKKGKNRFGAQPRK
tara:strand:- start:128 stop:535 length:408 start_codon:yes stop_codon:yes gene_type:complete